MLPPFLFYGLATALLIFGGLRVTYLGIFAGRGSVKPKSGEPSNRTDEAPDSDETIDGETRRERFRQPPRMGFGLINMMGLGRMSPAKRHSVMGGLWVVLGLYMAWTGFSLSRKQAQLGVESEVTERAPMRVIRANMAAPGAEVSAPSRAPAELKAPTELPAARPMPAPARK